MNSRTGHSFRGFVILTIIVACSMLATNLSAQVCGGTGTPPIATSQGQEFLLCFMQNELSSYDQTSFRYQDIYVASAVDTGGVKVTITCNAFPTWKKEIILNAREAQSYRLSDDPVVGATGNDALMEDCGSINQTVFRVVATSPIACYGMNNKQFTADAFLALPKTKTGPAGIEYRIMSYTNSTLLPQAEMPSEFAVAAFDSNTTVTIIPAAMTCNGDDSGKVLTYVLNAGEGIQIQADRLTHLLDMTGSIVRADKPIAVYGGHARAEAPNGYTYNDNGNQRTSRDHLCEAMPPLSTWGYSFVTKNFGRTGGDVVRILASVDGTVVKINNTVWGTPLRANAFRDTIIPLSSLALGNIITVETDKDHPILVGTIAHSAVNAAGTGDPFLAIVPPLDQMYSDFSYFICNDELQYYANDQHLIIAAEQGVVGDIAIDNVKIPAGAFTSIPWPMFGGRHYVATTVSQAMGPHRIVCPPIPGSGITILAYGWGNVISYGYTAGALLKPTHGIMPINSPSPGIAPGPGTSQALPPSIIIRNILTEPVYFDSARISYSQNKKNITVRLKKDIASQIGTIESAEEKTLELVTPEPIDEVITGNVRVWYHSKLWVDMYPVDFPFVITPAQNAGVSDVSSQVAVLENFPNPASGKTTVHFRIPTRAAVSVKIYDALGRVARTLMQTVVNSGDQNIQVNTKGMEPGDYTLELVAPELGISEHRHLVVIE
ncbi:MAG: T9SS type A sorting domain-containing protein [Bacteroidota bacterium]|nr:T9SS type A sorting domain-containing protein [Bacteroidota bacterium]MDP4231058.1 T9SS type A sorting domain-containing protein [Bacteroidota bacterium]MDP4234852.1 T9SS type A sorting domain-containing protein [Bacteroidota bacterium]